MNSNNQYFDHFLFIHSFIHPDNHRLSIHNSRGFHAEYFNGQRICSWRLVSTHSIWLTMPYFKLFIIVLSHITHKTLLSQIIPTSNHPKNTHLATITATILLLLLLLLLVLLLLLILFSLSSSPSSSPSPPSSSSSHNPGSFVITYLVIIPYTVYTYLENRNNLHVKQ